MHCEASGCRRALLKVAGSQSLGMGDRGRPGRAEIENARTGCVGGFLGSAAVYIDAGPGGDVDRFCNRWSQACILFERFNSPAPARNSRSGHRLSDGAPHRL